VFGLVAFLLGIGIGAGAWIEIALGLAIALSGATVINRARRALAEADGSAE